MQRLPATSVACLVAAGLCLVAIAHLPYGYYVFLRWIVSTSSVAIGLALLQRQRPGTALLAWGLAILYNPLIRISLDRTAWSVVNVASALVLVYLALLIRRSVRSSPSR